MVYNFLHCINWLLQLKDSTHAAKTILCKVNKINLFSSSNYPLPCIEIESLADSILHNFAKELTDFMSLVFLYNNSRSLIDLIFSTSPFEGKYDCMSVLSPRR